MGEGGQIFRMGWDGGADFWVGVEGVGFSEIKNGMGWRIFLMGWGRIFLWGGRGGIFRFGWGGGRF